jgi:stalled ribosome rescue protein Dom34
MKKEIGLWLDHREAIIVILTEGGEEVKHIRSNSGKHIRYSGSSHSKTPEGLKEVTSEDQRDRKFANTLNAFYDEIIASLRDADSVQIFGPGEAKGELGKRIDQAGLKADILAVETVDKMTDRQISAKVRQHFSQEQAPEQVRHNKHAGNDQKGDARKETQGYREQ